jgi:outer membrane protein OmpA-like peptidoglycan-associated protein
MSRLYTALLLLFSLHLFPQAGLPPGTYTSNNKKAVKLLKEGQVCLEITRNDACAEKNFKAALKEDPNFVEALMGLATLYLYQQKAAPAIENLKKATEINPKFYPKNFFDLGGLYYHTAQYEEAKTAFKQFMTFERVNPSLKDAARYYYDCSVFAGEQVKNPKPFNPENMGPAINTENDEYFCTITADNQYFYFTRKMVNDPSCEGHGKGQEDFYFSRRDNDSWLPAMLMKGVNSPCNEGAPTVSVDGQFMFFVGCEQMPTKPDENGIIAATGKPAMGSCDILFSQKVGENKWSKPFNLGKPVCTYQWETQPSFASDNKTLYFIRGIRKGPEIGSQDIYASTAGDDGRFGEPVKLGANINTEGREESVFIHPDNQTLYFVSDGHIGMGGLDIYMSRRQADGSWGPAINLGYPINTSADESSFMVSADGKKAFFHSNRPGGFGGDDLYSFDLPADVAPQKLTFVKGKVYDKNTKEPIQGTVDLVDLVSLKAVTRAYSDVNGNFLAILPGGKNYLMNIDKQGYLFYSDNFSLDHVEADYKKPFLLDVPLQPIDTGVAIELKNIFFDVDKFDLKPESKAECEKLVAFLKNNPRLRIEISGHTDSDGNKKANQVLSQNRAKAVYDYAVNAGIPAARMTYKGYGDSKPKVPNTTPENKAKNRRTEMKITGK